MSQEEYGSSPESIKNSGEMMTEHGSLSSEQEANYDAIQTGSEIDNDIAEDEDPAAIKLLSEETIKSYNSAVVSGEQPQLFANPPAGSYSPIDKTREYSGVGADRPSWTGDYIRGFSFYYELIAQRAQDPVIRENAAKILKQIASDWKFLRNKYGQKARY